jgi:signal peptide peptidase SppA
MTDTTQNRPMIVPPQAGPTLVRIAERVLGRPLLIHPQKAEIILHVLQGRIAVDASDLAPLSPDANRFAGNNVTQSGTALRQNGVAIIPVIGSLVNRGAWIGASSGMTSYEGLSAQLSDAFNDPNVHTLLLDIDSPGGEATGMFSLAAKVREVAKSKRVVAVVNDMAASAAYGIASAADEIVVSPTSLVGSIGVVLTHLDRSGELAAKGIRPTLIYAGRHKVDGNPFGPLSDAVMADLQVEVAKFYDQFVGLVAQGRGDRLTEDSARATEARTFLGQEAIDRGLADRMASFDAVLESLQSQKPPRPGQGKRGGRTMADQMTTPAAGVSLEAHTAAVNAARAEGEATGRKAGATEATARIGAILRSDAARGKQRLAMTLAFDTALSAEEAEKALSAAASEEAPKAVAGPAPIETRASGLNEFGAGGPAPEQSTRFKSGWSTAVQAANKSIGAAA